MANPFTSKSDEGFSENLLQLDALGLLANSWEAASDEYLGLDDFRRMLEKGSKGDLKGALKSALTGSLELGTSLIPGIGAAKLGKLATQIPKTSKVLKLLGAGAKTPLRGVTQNVAVPLAITGGMSAAAPALGGLMSRFRGAAPALAAAPAEAAYAYDPYRGARMLTNSPAAADDEALIRLMMQQGMI